MNSEVRCGWVGLALCAALGSLAGEARAAGPEWDKGAAARHLDARLEAWLGWPAAGRGGETRCLSCHTAVPLALARPSLGEVGGPEKKLLVSVKARVAGWDRITSWTAGDTIRPFYPGENKDRSLGTESVLNALVLVNHDARRNGGTLTDGSRKALGIMWSTQRAGGSWDWLDFGLRPWELDAGYYGAALAAVAVGKAGKAYYETALSAQEKKQLGKLREFLGKQFAKESLHNRLAALWASSHLPGVLTPEQQKALINEVLQLDPDGDAWSLAGLAQTKPGDRASWKPAHRLPPAAQYDGYATAFAVYVLKRAKAPAGSGKVARATAWLAKEKVAEGRGPVMYLNAKRDPDSAEAHRSMVGKFMRDAAAGFAVLALSEE